MSECPACEALLVGLRCSRHPSADFLAKCVAFGLIDNHLGNCHDRAWCIRCAQKLYSTVRRLESKEKNTRAFGDISSADTPIVEHLAKRCFSCEKCNAVYPKWHYARFGTDRSRARQACRSHSQRCDGSPPEVNPTNGVTFINQKVDGPKAPAFRLWDIVVAPLGNKLVSGAITLVRDTVPPSYVVQYAMGLTFCGIAGRSTQPFLH